MVKRLHVDIPASDAHLFDKLNTLEDWFIYKTFVEPALDKKVVIAFVEGKSGSGKSTAMVTLEMWIERVFQLVTGLMYKYDVVKQNIFVPQEYHTKIEQWTKNPYLTIGVDELRFLMPKAAWRSLLVQSVNEINETIRAIKVENMKKLTGIPYGGVIIYNSQSLTDVVKDTRKTVDVDLVLNRTKVVRVRAYTFWHDRSDIERIKLRQERLKFEVGDLVIKVSTDTVVSPPPAAVMHEFTKHSIEAKGEIFQRKREKILRELEKELGIHVSIKEQLQQPEIWDMVMSLVRSRKGKIYWTSDAKKVIMKMFGLTRNRFYKEFVPAFEEIAKEKGLM